MGVREIDEVLNSWNRGMVEFNPKPRAAIDIGLSRIVPSSVTNIHETFLHYAWNSEEERRTDGALAKRAGFMYTNVSNSTVMNTIGYSCGSSDSFNKSVESMVDMGWIYRINNNNKFTTILGFSTPDSVDDKGNKIKGGRGVTFFEIFCSEAHLFLTRCVELTYTKAGLPVPKTSAVPGLLRRIILQDFLTCRAYYHHADNGGFKPTISDLKEETYDHEFVLSYFEKLAARNLKNAQAYPLHKYITSSSIRAGKKSAVPLNPQYLVQEEALSFESRVKAPGFENDPESVFAESAGSVSDGSLLYKRDIQENNNKPYLQNSSLGELRSLAEGGTLSNDSRDKIGGEIEEIEEVQEDLISAEIRKFRDSSNTGILAMIKEQLDNPDGYEPVIEEEPFPDDPDALPGDGSLVGGGFYFGILSFYARTEVPGAGLNKGDFLPTSLWKMLDEEQKNEVLQLLCLWDDVILETPLMRDFKRHIAPRIAHKPKPPNSKTYVWKEAFKRRSIKAVGSDSPLLAREGVYELFSFRLAAAFQDRKEIALQAQMRAEDEAAEEAFLKAHAEAEFVDYDMPSPSLTESAASLRRPEVGVPAVDYDRAKAEAEVQRSQVSRAQDVNDPMNQLALMMGQFLTRQEEFAARNDRILSELLAVVKGGSSNPAMVVGTESSQKEAVRQEFEIRAAKAQAAVSERFEDGSEVNPKPVKRGRGRPPGSGWRQILAASQAGGDVEKAKAPVKRPPRRTTPDGEYPKQARYLVLSKPFYAKCEAVWLEILKKYFPESRHHAWEPYDFGGLKEVAFTMGWTVENLTDMCRLLGIYLRFYRHHSPSGRGPTIAKFISDFNKIGEKLTLIDRLQPWLTELYTGNDIRKNEHFIELVKQARSAGLDPNAIGEQVKAELGKAR